MQTAFYSLYASLMSGIGWMFIFICFALFGLLGSPFSERQGLGWSKQ